MHASFRVGETTVMASDGRCGGQPSFQGFALSLTVVNAAEAERLFKALVEGGQVIMPLATTFFSPRFGMATDRFGVSWMVYVVPPGAVSGGKGEALAKQVEAKAAAAIATLEQLSDAEWSKTTEAEKWSVGVTAHHVAGVFGAVAQTIETIAGGRPFETFPAGAIDQMNAQHARDFAGCAKAETIELFRKGVTAAAASVRTLSDEQFAKSAKVMAEMPPMTVEQIVTGALLSHLDDHLGSIRKTVGR